MFLFWTEIVDRECFRLSSWPRQQLLSASKTLGKKLGRTGSKSESASDVTIGYFPHSTRLQIVSEARRKLLCETGVNSHMTPRKLESRERTNVTSPRCQQAHDDSVWKTWEESKTQSYTRPQWKTICKLKCQNDMAYTRTFDKKILETLWIFNSSVT